MGKRVLVDQSLKRTGIISITKVEGHTLNRGVAAPPEL